MTRLVQDEVDEGEWETFWRQEKARVSQRNQAQTNLSPRQSPPERSQTHPGLLRWWFGDQSERDDNDKRPPQRPSSVRHVPQGPRNRGKKRTTTYEATASDSGPRRSDPPGAVWVRDYGSRERLGPRVRIEYGSTRIMPGYNELRHAHPRPEETPVDLYEPREGYRIEHWQAPRTMSQSAAVTPVIPNLPPNLEWSDEEELDIIRPINGLVENRNTDNDVGTSRLGQRLDRRAPNYGTQWVSKHEDGG